MLASGKANPFLYSADVSAPNVSRQMIKVNPNTQFSSTTARTTQEFKLPRAGFLTNMYLRWGIQSSDWSNNGTSGWAGCEAIESVAITARGHEIRKADALALEWEILEENNYNKRQNFQDAARIATAAITANRYFYINLGKALGLEQAAQLALDTSFLENLTVSVTYRAVSDFSEAATGAEQYSDAHLYCEYSKLEAADYDMFRSEQYSASQPTKSLCMSWEHEPDVTMVSSSGVSARTGDTIDIKHKGLVQKTVFALAHETFRDAADDTVDRCSFNTISSVKLYADGQIVYECDDDAMLRLMLSPSEAVNCTAATIAFANDSPHNIYCLDFSQMNLPNKMQDKLTGALNTADLSSVYLELNWTPAANVDWSARVAHKVYQMQSVDGASGFVEVSRR